MLDQETFLTSLYVMDILCDMVAAHLILHTAAAAIRPGRVQDVAMPVATCVVAHEARRLREFTGNAHIAAKAGPAIV